MPEIHPCHTAAILSRETKRALFYHAKPRNGNHGMRPSVVKQSFFGPPGQYGRLVTRANGKSMSRISKWPNLRHASLKDEIL